MSELLLTLGPAAATLILGLATGRWAQRTTKAELDVELMRLAREMTLEANAERQRIDARVDELVAIVRMLTDALGRPEPYRKAAEEEARERLSVVMGWNTGDSTT